MAQTGARRALLGGAPWWRRPDYAIDGVAPGLVADFVRGRFALLGRPLAFADLFTLTSGVKWLADASGTLSQVAAGQPAVDVSSGRRRWLLEGASTNVLLNSAAPTTSSVAVTAGTWTLSFWGTGSITLSGAASGTLTGTGAATRVSLTVTATAGTLTLTVSGAVANAQLEVAPAATSYIPTTGGAITRPTDVAALTSTAATVLQGAAAAIAWRGTVGSIVAYQQLLSVPSGTLIGQNGSAGISLYGSNDTTGLAATNSSLPGDVALCAGFSPAGKIVASKGSAAVTIATLVDRARTSVSIGPVTGLANGQILALDELVVWSLADRPSATAAQAQARTWQ